MGKKIAIGLCALIFTQTVPQAFAQTDSTRAIGSAPTQYGDVAARTTWDRVAKKPATATRWPKWSEITGKPSTFPAAPHNHDSLYVRKNQNSTITKNLTVKGTVSGNRLVTNDVGGERWCKATASGRIQCTNDLPTRDIFDAARIKIVRKEVCLNNKDVNYVWAKCPSGTRVISCSGGPGDVREDGEGYFVRVDPDKNGCELMIGKPVCSSSRPWTYQNVFATCIR